MDELSIVLALIAVEKCRDSIERARSEAAAA
jgi:hypothetical protein